MRILVMCEGTNEEVLLNILLKANALKFTEDDLIGQRVYPIRQLNVPIIQSELKMYGKPVKIYRVGDTQHDKIKIPNNLTHIVSNSEIYKYCTKPELEMLLILNEGLENVYEKEKNKITPKNFAKKNITYNGKKYDQSSKFLEEYFGGKNVMNLIKSIKKYKSYKRHNNKNELFLADLLK